MVALGWGIEVEDADLYIFSEQLSPNSPDPHQ
jgi:hypothetical protein